MIAGQLCPAAGTWQCYAGDAPGYRQMLGVLAVAALNADNRGFGGEGRGADYNTGNADKMRDGEGGEVADGGLRGGGVEEELVFRKLQVVEFGRGVDDPLGALL